MRWYPASVDAGGKTDPNKAVVALKWAVREMENRYRNMAKVGVRNIDDFNKYILDAKRKGEFVKRRVQTGFDEERASLFTKKNS